MRLHRKALAHRKLFHMGTFDTEAFTDRRFSQRSSLHRVSYTHRMATECAKYFPVLLGTTSLHKARHSTTSYFKACTKYFPVLLCTTRHAQSTSQYYFVPQSLYKTLASLIYIYIYLSYYFLSLVPKSFFKLRWGDGNQTAAGVRMVPCWPFFHTSIYWELVS